MLRTIHLHGRLSQCGGPYEFDVATAREGVRALLRQVKPVAKIMSEGEYQIVISRTAKPEGRDLDIDDLGFQLGQHMNHIHVVPVVAGAKRGGFGKVIMGAVLVAATLMTAGAASAAAGQIAAGQAMAGGLGVEAAAAVSAGSGAIGSGLGATAFSVFGQSVTYGSILKTGAIMALSGVSQMLTPTPKVSQSNYQARERPDQRASFLFNGAVNTSEQGGPVPLVYGRFRVGSVVISAGVSSEDDSTP